jgi:hypothetical protein
MAPYASVGNIVVHSVNTYMYEIANVREDEAGSWAGWLLAIIDGWE